MLGNFEISRPSLGVGISQINYSDLTGITSLFLVSPSTSILISDVNNLSKWIEKVTDGDMFPVHNIKDVSDETEEPDILESKQKFRYQARRGNYRFTFMVNVDVDYFIKLKRYEGQNLKAYFADKNGNIIGVLGSSIVGDTLLPFSVSSIMVKKIGFGKFDVSFVGITVDLSKPEEMESGYVFKPDFNIIGIDNEEAFIDDITSIDAYTMTFSVIDSCGNNITGLTMVDFTIEDEVSGTLTNSDFSELGDGVYQYESNEAQYLGKVILASLKYNATADYSFDIPEFSPVDFSEDFKIT